MYRRELEMYSKPSDDSRKLLEQAISRIGLSARAFDRIFKVAPTIADLAESVNV
jgi:magnesium chelatase family protein